MHKARLNYRRLGLILTTALIAGVTTAQAIAANHAASKAKDASIDRVLREIAKNMVAMPAGSFLMGDPKADGQEWEKPAHIVKFKGFRLSKYDVTYDQYDAFTRATRAAEKPDLAWGRGRRPVITVTWQDARNFIHWVNAATGKHYRLPSDAEFEYAARAGTATVYPWGDRDDPARRNGAGVLGKSSPVGVYPPNAWGLYDMIGNVWQWTQDCWNENYVGAPVDGSAWMSGHCERGHVYRGGCWDNDPTWLRSSGRGSGTDDEAPYDGLGFRLAEDL